MMATEDVKTTQEVEGHAKNGMCWLLIGMEMNHTSVRAKALETITIAETQMEKPQSGVTRSMRRKDGSIAIQKRRQRQLQLQLRRRLERALCAPTSMWMAT